MRFHWLLSGFIGVFLFCSPAEAGKLTSWEFREQDSNLTFTTDEGVQPKAQLLSNPTRLVIDLPDTTLEGETVKQSYQGPIQGFRVGQPESDTSRIVVEFAPGYTVDSDDIKFQDDSATDWQVEIPQANVSRVNTASDTDDEVIDLELPEVDISESSDDEAGDSTLAMANSPHIKATRNGFFIDIDGSRKIKIDSERDGDRIDFFLEGITLPDDLDSETVEVNQYGVSTIDFEQVTDEEVKISLEVEKESPEWLATFSRIQGLLLVPRGKLPVSTASVTPPESSDSSYSSDSGLSRSDRTSEPPQPLGSLGKLSKLSLISEIELKDDLQLLINGEDELSAVASRQGNGIYQITIDNADLARDFQGPELESGSPVSQIKVRQENSQVIIEVTTRLGYRLGQLSTDDKAIALPIEVGAAPLLENNAPLLPPGFAKAPKQRPLADVPTSLSTDGRPRVMIDPGHGGDDPGAVGIGGLREKDVVLPIGLDVAEILRGQGIDVVMSRDNDVFVSLEGITDIANDSNVDLFVSIHANSINLSRPDVSGLETYYYNSGRRLAELIHYSILNGVNIDDRSIRRARFYVLKHSIAPAVLVEVGFVTGAEDASNLKEPNHRRQMAEAIARGIIEYIKQNNP